jgi:hypothetical protein
MVNSRSQRANNAFEADASRMRTTQRERWLATGLTK